MSNPTSVDESGKQAQAATTATPASSTAPATTSAPAQESDGEQFDEARARATIQRQRESEKALKSAVKEREAQLADTLAKLKSFEDAQLSESERTAKRAAELQNELEKARATVDTLTERTRSLAIGYEVALASSALGVVPELAEKLLDRSLVEYDEAGKPKNVRALLDALVKKYPQLAGSASAASAAGTPKPSSAQARAATTVSPSATAQKPSRVLKSF